VTYIVHLKPLNGITFGTETNWFQYPTGTNKQISCKVDYVWMINFGLVFQDKFDPNNWLIPLSMIPLSDAPVYQLRCFMGSQIVKDHLVNVIKSIPIEKPQITLLLLVYVLVHLHCRDYCNQFTIGPKWSH
jgi:hypothetical protein